MTSMNRYMAILHGTKGAWGDIPEPKQRELMGKYMAWAEHLKAKHGFEGGSELRETYRTLKNVKGTTYVDGPYAETKEILTGYFVFLASSIDEAAEIARACPALLHGDWVQVYEMPPKREPAADPKIVPARGERSAP
jgi:hypothetical protein